MSNLDQTEEKIILLSIKWLAVKFFEGHRQLLLAWVADYLNDNAVDILRQQMLLDHPDRIKAEELIQKFLDRDLTRPLTRRTTESRMHRNTDWGRTQISKLVGPAQCYVNRRVEHVPDIPLLSGLFGIALLWCQQLAGLSHKHERYIARSKAMDHACSTIRFSPLAITYDANMSSLLRRCDGGKELADLLDKVQTILWQQFDPEKDGKLLVQLFEKESAASSDQPNSERCYIDRTNADNMLEMIATLALAKAFVDQGWRPEKNIFKVGLKLSEGLTLKKNGLTLHIRKGFPEEVKATDRSIELLKAVEYNNASGKQPDIVLCFRCDLQKLDPIYLIADAKRNQKNDGAQYRRMALFSILTDLVAFGHKIGFTVSDKQKGCFDAKVKPCGLLFFKQMKTQQDFDNESVVTAFGFDEYVSLFHEEQNQESTRLIQTVEAIEKSVAEKFRQEAEGHNSSERQP
ncbi:hypothetical protein [Pelovirga terrestris]|uniref:Uncharacterized protein n=1 Tax=Pelovirga terrestris TaxID=2771352 RepID=A0A8J6R588_9BACT|nr:hypothetical protein [Pelovirga terrestris]MBD1399999.1 hypothetical protein [Pelovirga terrestris]